MQLKKNAVTPYIPSLTPEYIDVNNKVKAQVLRDILRTGLFGIGAGVATGGIIGLMNSNKKLPQYPIQTDVSLPYPQVKKKKKEQESEQENLLAKTSSNIFDYLDAVQSRISNKPTSMADLAGEAGRRIKSQKIDPSGVVGSTGIGSAAESVMQMIDNPRSGRELTSGLPTSMILGAAAGGISNALTQKAVKPVAEMAANRWAPLDYSYANRQQPATTTAIEKTSSDGDWADAFTRQFLSAPVVSQSTGGAGGGGATTTTPTSPAPGGVPLFSSAWFRGDSQTNPNSIPWSLPAKGVAGVGGLIGGHQLVRYLLKKKRKADIDKELNAAKKEYQEAMLTSYDPAKLRELRPKEAAAVTSTTALDRCFDIFEKYGNLDPLLGQAAGMYSAFAIPAATLASIAGYRWARSRSQDKLLADALKRRAAIRSKQNPFDIHVQPTPVEYIDEEEEKKKKV